MTDLGIVRDTNDIGQILKFFCPWHMFCLFFKIRTLLMTREITDSNWAYSCLYKKQLQKKKLKGL